MRQPFGRWVEANGIGFPEFIRKVSRKRKWRGPSPKVPERAFLQSPPEEGSSSKDGLPSATFGSDTSSRPRAPDRGSPTSFWSPRAPSRIRTSRSDSITSEANSGLLVPADRRRVSLIGILSPRRRLSPEQSLRSVLDLLPFRPRHRALALGSAGRYPPAGVALRPDPIPRQRDGLRAGPEFLMGTVAGDQVMAGDAVSTQRGWVTTYRRPRGHQRPVQSLIRPGSKPHAGSRNYGLGEDGMPVIACVRWPRTQVDESSHRSRVGEGGARNRRPRVPWGTASVPSPTTGNDCCRWHSIPPVQPVQMPRHGGQRRRWVDAVRAYRARRATWCRRCPRPQPGLRHERRVPGRVLQSFSKYLRCANRENLPGNGGYVGFRCEGSP
jgi:hypothetical protein